MFNDSVVVAGKRRRWRSHWHCRYNGVHHATSVDSCQPRDLEYSSVECWSLDHEDHIGHGKSDCSLLRCEQYQSLVIVFLSRVGVLTRSGHRKTLDLITTQFCCLPLSISSLYINKTCPNSTIWRCIFFKESLLAVGSITKSVALLERSGERNWTIRNHWTGWPF